MSSLPYLKRVADQPAATYLDRAIANLRDALREHPEDELHLKQQILIYLHVQEKEDETIELASELIEMDVDKIYVFDCFFILARMYAKKNDSIKTIEYYRKAIAANPASDEPIIELASFYETQLDYDAAIAVYDYLNNESFSDIKKDMYRYKGLCYYNKKEYEKALECFQASLEIYGDDEGEELNTNIGACFFNMKNFTEAFSRFRKSLKMNPQSAEAHYGLGLCYQHTNDSYRAMHHYFEAIKLKPDYTDAYNNIAAVTINQEGDYKTGIEMLKKAINNCSDKQSMIMVYMNLSRVYNKLHEFTLADYYKAEYMKSLGFDFLFEEEDDD
jgi:tetratricopeptide (TPR) repeat protein